MVNVTLNQIREHGPCQDGWKKLLKHLGKTRADDEPLSLVTILENNGINDAIWCLCALPEKHVNTVRLFACDVAERVLHIYEKSYPNDSRPRDCINTARLYANGKATYEQLVSARDASRTSAETSADAAWAAADAAWAAADAARAAAWAAAAWAAADAARAAGAEQAEQAEQAELFRKYFGEEQ